MARQTIDGVSTELSRLVKECDLVEQKLHCLEMKLALLEQKTANIEKDVASVFGYSSWAGKLFFGAIIMAATGFLLTGGFS